MVRILGDDATAILLHHLIDLQTYHQRHGQARNGHVGGWFPVTAAKLEEDLGWNRTKQWRTLRQLDARKLIEIKSAGRWGTRYIKLDFTAINQLLCDDFAPEKPPLQIETR